jgi:hypothetical protein
MTREQVEAFKKTIGPLLPDWKSFELRVIAERGRAGDWVLNSMRAILCPESPMKSGRNDLPRVEGLLVVHEWRDIDELFGLMDAMLEGEIHVGRELIGLKRPNTSPPPPSLYVRKWDRQHTLAEFGIDFSSLVLAGEDTITSRLLHDPFRTVNAVLRAANPPWDGLEDLRRNFMGIPRDQAPRSDLSSFEVVAPLAVNLSDSSVLEGKQLKAVVTTQDGTSADQIVLSAVSYHVDGSVARIRRVPNRESTEGAGQSYMTIELPEVPSKVSLLLTYRGLDADRLDFIGEAAYSTSPRLAVLREIAGGIERLSEGLDSARTRGKEIEGWVALVFHLLGFAPAHYGSTSWEAPDIVAFFDSDSWILVIECTEREPDIRNKLTKLATRAKKLERASGTKAYPVLVTALDRSLLNKTDLDKASKESIAIVSADEYRDLLNLALEGGGPAETHSLLERLIPGEGRTSPYGIRR